MSHLKQQKVKMLEVQFVGDDDVLNHILDKEEGAKFRKDRAQVLVNVKKLMKKQENDQDEDDQDDLKDENYVDILGADSQEYLKNGCVASGGNKVYSFQTRKKPEKMAELAYEIAKTSGKSVPLICKNTEKMASTPQSSKKQSTSEKDQLKSDEKNEFLSTPYRLRKRLTAVSTFPSDTESEYSDSNSEDDKGIKQEEEKISEVLMDQKRLTKHSSLSSSSCKKVSAKKMKKDTTTDLVEEYFEAHSSSKVLTSDRTLQKLKRTKLDQQTLHNLLSKFSPPFSAELKQLNEQYERLFHKWMLQLHLGFNIVLYGLGSKKELLEKFRASMLQDSVHVVINGFFPGITVKSILNSITEEILEHMGTFRSVLDQLDWIINRFKDGNTESM